MDLVSEVGKGGTEVSTVKQSQQCREGLFGRALSVILARRRSEATGYLVMEAALVSGEVSLSGNVSTQGPLLEF